MIMLTNPRQVTAQLRRGAALASVDRRLVDRDDGRRCHARRPGRSAQCARPRPLRSPGRPWCQPVLAAIGFVSVSLLPFVAYPPNPPAIGDPETIGTRTALYFIMLAISIIAAVTATWLGAGSRVDGILVRHAERHRRLPAGDPHSSGVAAELLGGAG